MIVADTTSSRPLLVSALCLCFEDCSKQTACTSRREHINELRRAVEVGCAFLEPILAEISSEGDLDLVELTRPEILAVKDLPGSLVPERLSPSRCVFTVPACACSATTNVRETSVGSAGFLASISRRSCALWVRKVLNKKKVKELIRQIETEQGMVIKNKDEILK